MTERPRPPWSWHGVVALALALPLSAGWAAGIAVLMLSDVDASPAAVAALDGLGHTLAGAVAAYLGYQAGSQRAGQAQPGP